MVPKDYEKMHGDTFVTGGGRPFDMPERTPEKKTTDERNKKMLIDLAELEKPGTGPVNFIRSAGRVIGSFDTGQDPDDVS